MGQKGFCEDLDEGKFSFPVVHCLLSPHVSSTPGLVSTLELRNIFMSRDRWSGQGLSHEMKLLVLDMLNSAGSLEYCREVLKRLNVDLEAEIAAIEGMTGVQNPILRALAKKLRL